MRRPGLPTCLPCAAGWSTDVLFSAVLPSSVLLVHAASTDGSYLQTSLRRMPSLSMLCRLSLYCQDRCEPSQVSSNAG